MKEIWKEVNLFGKQYFISNLGFIKNKHNKILKPYLSSGEYKYICIHEKKHTHHIRIHRIVAQAFIPNPQKLSCVNHKDGNKQNNCVKNLEWVNYSQNVKHGFESGLYQVRKIKATRINQYDLQGNFIKTWDSMRKVEKQYNVSHTALRFCCLNKIKSCAGYIWRYADK